MRFLEFCQCLLMCTMKVVCMILIPVLITISIMVFLLQSKGLGSLYFLFTYKLMEQLMIYYNDWKVNLNIKQTLSLTLDDRKVVHDLIRNPQRSLQITVAPQQQMQSHQVTSGLQFLTTMDLDHNSDTEANAISTGFSQQMEPINEPGPSFQSCSAAVAKSVASKSLSRPATKTAQKGRPCRKCGVEGCPGRKEVKHCTNMCQDCGLVNCLGRNSKRPNKTCKDGWKDD